MTAKHLKEFADLYAKGFRPYTGEVLETVYEKLKCWKQKQAYWVVSWPLLYCFGCDRRCCPRTPEGFQVVLPTVEAKRFGEFGISPAEMVAAKSLLRADEAAYCLNVSRSQVYTLAAEGKLVRHKEQPWRVTAESVKDEMERVDI